MINNHKAIKRYENIVEVVNSLPTANYPHSYLRIRKMLKKLRDSIFENEKQILEAEAEVMGQLSQPISAIANLSAVQNLGTGT